MSIERNSVSSVSRVIKMRIEETRKKKEETRNKTEEVINKK